MDIENTEKIQEFLDNLNGATIISFRCLEWWTDPRFLIKTNKGSFVLHSNDIGVFITVDEKE